MASFHYFSAKALKKIKEHQHYKLLRFNPKGPGKFRFAFHPKYAEKYRKACEVNREVVNYGKKAFPELANSEFDNERDAFENALFSYLCIQKNNYNVPECQLATDAYQRSAAYKPESRIMDLLNDKIGRVLGFKSRPDTTFETAAKEVKNALKKGCLFTKPIDLCEDEENAWKLKSCLH